MTIVLFLLLDCAYLGNDVFELYGGLQYQKSSNINFCNFHYNFSTLDPHHPSRVLFNRADSENNNI